MTQYSFELPKNTYALTITNVQHYTDRLFRFETDRDMGFRFKSGEFVMIALPSDKPIWRAYSVASPSWHEGLEFFSIKVPDGPLTSLLQKIQPNDTIWMKKKSTGTLVLDALLPGKNLYLFSTGTGVAPFASVIRDIETYEKFNYVILTHTTREVKELTYSEELIKQTQEHELLSEIIQDKLLYYGTTTRESSPRMGRITDLLHNGKFIKDLNLQPLNPDVDRAMICGSMAMLHDIKNYLEDLQFTEGSNARPGDFVIEKAFVE